MKRRNGAREPVVETPKPLSVDKPSGKRRAGVSVAKSVRGHGRDPHSCAAQCGCPAWWGNRHWIVLTVAIIVGVVVTVEYMARTLPFVAWMMGRPEPEIVRGAAAPNYATEGVNSAYRLNYAVFRSRIADAVEVSREDFGSSLAWRCDANRCSSCATSPALATLPRHDDRLSYMPLVGVVYLCSWFVRLARPASVLTPMVPRWCDRIRLLKPKVPRCGLPLRLGMFRQFRPRLLLAATWSGAILSMERRR